MTRPPAVRNSGVQPGSVDGATRISPGSRCAPTGSRITRAGAGDGAGRGRRAGERPVRGCRGDGRRLGFGAVGEQHPRDVPAAQLRARTSRRRCVDRASRRSAPASAGACLGEVEEEDVVGRGDAGPAAASCVADQRRAAAHGSRATIRRRSTSAAPAGRPAAGPGRAANRPAGRAAGRARPPGARVVDHLLGLGGARGRTARPGPRAGSSRRR